MRDLIQDFRFGARLLMKQKGFALTAILTVAACIGANGTIFSIVNAVVLRPLPFPHSDRIVVIYNSYPRAGVERATNGVPDYYDRLRETDVFEHLAMHRPVGMTIGEQGRPERIRAITATPSMLRVVGARAHRGRLFTDADGEPGQERKVVLTYGLWQRLFGGQDAAIGKDLRINGTPYSVIGVLPDDFLFLSSEYQMWTPAAFTARDKSDERRHSNNWEMVGLLEPGRTIAQAQQQIDAINARNMERFPHFRQILINAGFTTHVLSGHEELIRNVRSTLYLLWGGVAFVLLIGCVNLTNLVLVRSSARVKELATRHALGAGLGRLARQLLAETTLTTVLGAAVGLALAYWSLELLTASALANLPRADEIALDWSGVGFTAALAIAVGLAIGVIPVAAIYRMNLNQAVREEGRSGTAGRGARLVRRGLVASQIAFAFMLLIAAGLLLASFRRVLAVDPGFEPRGVLTGNVNLPASRYPDDPALRTFMGRALERLRAIPGVQSVGATTTIPFGGAVSDSVILAEGYQMAPGESLISPHQIVATSGYFDTMQIPIVSGRFFNDGDTAESMRVVIVDEQLAKRFWPNADPVGRRMWSPDSAEELNKGPGPKTRYFTVVGVVARIAIGGLVSSREDERIGAYYFPFTQSTENFMTIALRANGDPKALASTAGREITALDPDLPFYNVRTMLERMDETLTNRRTPMMLAVMFGGLALFLAAVGIYGVLAYQVSQRTREMGIRMALGSDARGIFSLVIREGVFVIGAGFAIGLAGAFALRQSIAAQLYETQPMDPAVLAGVAGTLGLVALAACAVPARRAARIDPIVALAEQ